LSLYVYYWAKFVYFLSHSIEINQFFNGKTSNGATFEADNSNPCKLRKKIMCKNKILKIQCQISIENIKLKKFDINTSAANDEENIGFSRQFKYYSIRDLMTILNISTIKEVKYLIKNLELEQSKYRSLNSHKKWVYNNNALNILKLYLKYKAA
jgi:hypothetical protein